MTPTPDYVRELPDLHPALCGVVWRGGVVADEDVSATVLDWARRGILDMRTVEMHQTRVIGGPRGIVTTRLAFDSSRWAELDPIDQHLASFLFTQIAGDATLTLDELEQQSRVRANEFHAGLSGFKRFLASEAAERGYLEEGTASTFRRTDAGDALASTLEGLRAFLADFGSFSDDTAAHVELWEGYLVFATVFGLAEQVADSLAVHGAATLGGQPLPPVWSWVTAGPDRPSPLARVAGMLEAGSERA